MNRSSTVSTWLVILVMAASVGAESANQPTLAEILRPIVRREAPPTLPVETSSSPIKVPVRVISLSDVLAALTKTLNKSQSPGERVEVSTVAVWAPVALEPGASWELSLENRFNPGYQGRWTAHFAIRVDGEIVGSWRLPVQATLYRNVWMASERMGREDAPSPPLIRAVEMMDSRLPQDWISAATDLSGHELVRSLSADRVLTWDDVRVRPAVRRGDVVQVSVNHGALNITMPALALEDGQVGDNIRLRNVDTSREISGVVSQSKQVTIQLRNDHENQ